MTARRWAAVAAAAGLVLGSAAVAVASHGYFDDVPSSHPYAIGIMEAHTKGLFEGYSDTEFRPDQLLTNKQAETVLRRMLDRYTDDDGNSTLTRGEAAQLLAYGVCGIDNCLLVSPWSAQEVSRRNECNLDALAMRRRQASEVNAQVFGPGGWRGAEALKPRHQAERDVLLLRCPHLRD